MRVLADTSVWVGHFKHANERLVELLDVGLVVCHPHIVVEVACGTPPNRREIIEMLGQLDQVPVATHDELLSLVERRAFAGRGCGFVDVSLLAATLLSDATQLWSLDRRLDAAAAELGKSYRPNH